MLHRPRRARARAVSLSVVVAIAACRAPATTAVPPTRDVAPSMPIVPAPVTADISAPSVREMEERGGRVLHKPVDGRRLAEVLALAVEPRD